MTIKQGSHLHRWLWPVCGIGIVVGFFNLCLEPRDSPLDESIYASGEEAVAYRNTWLPMSFPSDVTEVRLATYRSSGEMWGRFTPSLSTVIPELYVNRYNEYQGETYIADANLNGWWPQALTGDVNTVMLKAIGWRFSLEEEGARKFFYAMPPSRKWIYFWTGEEARVSVPNYWSKTHK